MRLLVGKKKKKLTEGCFNVPKIAEKPGNLT